MKQQPLISVLMCIYNGKKYLTSAIGSIVTQTYRHIEYIIIDDGSADNSSAIIKKIADPRIKLYRITHKGVARALNVGLTFAKGKYIARMDADDIALSSRLEKQVQFLEHHDDVGVVGTAVTLIDAFGNQMGVKQFPQTPKKLQSALLWTNPLIHPTVMFRKALIDRYGGYDKALDGAEDYDLWLRFAKHTYLANLPDTLLQYRIHTQSVSCQHQSRLMKAFLRARWKSIRHNNYPWWHCIFLFKPFISLMVPQQIKQNFYKIKYRHE